MFSMCMVFAIAVHTCSLHVYAVINTSYIHPYKTGDTFNENQAARHVCGFVGNKQLRDLEKTCNLMFSDSSGETLWTELWFTECP